MIQVILHNFYKLLDDSLSMDNSMEYISLFINANYSKLGNIGDKEKKVETDYTRFKTVYVTIKSGRLNPIYIVLVPENYVMGSKQRQESIKSIDDILNKAPAEKPNLKSDNDKNYGLKDKINSIYQKFINSEEGKEFIKYLKQKGNDTARTGTIDDILIVNKGKELVAATTPDSKRKNLIINKDYIGDYVEAASNATGLTKDQVVENIIAHELHHIYGQKLSERRGNVKDIEYNNDISLIKFYTGLAQKYVEHSDTYLTKAKLFASRYEGTKRSTMDELIYKVQDKVYTPEKNVLHAYIDQPDIYRNAA